MLAEKANFVLNNKLGAIFTFITTLISIWLAVTANRLSLTAINLTKNDSSQQAQIDYLKGLLVEVKGQSDVGREQTKELIKITEEANNIDQSTNKLLLETKNQANLFYQQLLFTKKSDSISSADIDLAKERDLFSLRERFERIRDVEMTKKVMLLYLSKSPDVSAVSELRSLFENGLNNKLLLADSTLKKDWYSYYQYLKIYEDEIKIYRAQGYPANRSDDIKRISGKIRDQYIFYINKIWARLDFLEKQFREKLF